MVQYKKKKQRSCKPSKKDDIWTKIKNVYYWLCLVLVILTFIAIIIQIVYVQTRRHRVMQDPVETEAIVTHIGEPTRGVGPKIYYRYQVNGSTLQGHFCPGGKVAKKIHIGQTIVVNYERSDSSNSIALRRQFITTKMEKTTKN